MQVNTKQLNQLADVIVTLDNRRDAIEFLRGILTSKELSEMTNRLQIVKKLKKGVPQHQIAQDLGVGIATVTRGSKELQLGRFKHV